MLDQKQEPQNEEGEEANEAELNKDSVKSQSEGRSSYVSSAIVRGLYNQLNEEKLKREWLEKVLLGYLEK